MSIVAAFDKTIFFNPASKYAVLRLKTADLMIPENARNPYHYGDHLTRFVAVGYDLPQTDSIKIELEGTWIDGKHGCQFQVEHWREIIPPTIPGIRAYLASGLLKGIGKKTADAIVDKFGTDSLNVLERCPEKLLEIRGITEDKLEEIKTGYAESKTLRELMTLLGPFQVTPAAAMKIYQHFGAGGVELIRESPFRLCQVPGFGFKRIDAILQKSGGDLHDPMRVQGALFYALEKSRNEGGHLYMEISQLIRTALQLLNEDIAPQEERLTQEEAEHGLETMILTNIVVSRDGNIYLPHVYAEECETARRVEEMTLEVPEPVEQGPVLEQVKRQLGVTLSRRQAEGVEMAFRHNLSIITGGPGTGKSTILKAVVESFRHLYPGKKISLSAPTGKASRRMAETTGIKNAQTLHSLLGLHGDGGSHQRKELETDLLIVDEASMADMWLAHEMFMRLRPGTKVLLVGDADQLESVGAGSVFQELIASGVVPVTVLDQIFRQAEDSRIAYNARSINNGDSELLYGADFTFIRAETQEESAEMIRSLYKMEAAKSGVRNVQLLSPYRSEGRASAQALNEAVREEINPACPDRPEIMSGGKLFRLGDRVLQTKNNYDLVLKNREGKETGKGVFNGEIGKVCGIKPGFACVEFDGRFAVYSSENLDELDLAYAMTVHKAMGSEFDVVIIPMLATHRILLTRNLFYTAVTRARKKVILVGQKKALFMAIARTRKGKRNTLLAERMRLFHQTMTRRAAPMEKPPMKRAS